MSATRRAFVASAAAAAVSRGAPPPLPFDSYFLDIYHGFLRNARRTSSSYAVCDFEGGTILPGSVAKSGKTYDSVTRMLPALAAWAAKGRDGRTPELSGVLVDIFRHAFDPQHPDYWSAADPRRQDQRQVESSIVAWSLWLARDNVLPRLSAAERANVQAWLASCTKVPVRRNNWAWFTAVNQAVRLALSEKWKEFSGDERWMRDDLEFLNTLAAPGADGWYTDSQREPMYDYYNFWVFASHFLYWNHVVGARYPEWRARFEARLRAFLKNTPCFFGENGSHVLFGRSLIYRFAVLTPLVLAYGQGLWPHPAGLLRAIVRRNLEFHWAIGGFDAQRGKLRETYSARGNRDICDSYIDNGHPYWGMQAFAMLLIPANDLFWTAREEPLPVERGNFRVRFEELGMMLAGSKASGQVRWLQAVNRHAGADYRDKYTKLSYSTHFPFNVLPLKDSAAWDGALIFRDPTTGVCAARAGVKRGGLTAKGTETEWWTMLNGMRIDVVTRVDVDGDMETRAHTVSLPAGGAAEAIEGSAALGLAEDESPEERTVAGSLQLRSARTGLAIATWGARGWGRPEAVDAFDKSGRMNVNVIYPRMRVITLRAPLRGGVTTLESRHYAGNGWPE